MEKYAILKLSDLTKEEQNSVVLYQLDMPVPNIDLEYEIEIDGIEQKLEDHFCFWNADCLTELKRLEFEFSKMEASIESVSAQAFFTSPEAQFVKSDGGGRITIPYEGWVMAGQGAILHWRLKSEGMFKE